MATDIVTLAVALQDIPGVTDQCFKGTIKSVYRDMYFGHSISALISCPKAEAIFGNNPRIPRQRVGSSDSDVNQKKANTKTDACQTQGTCETQTKSMPYAIKCAAIMPAQAKHKPDPNGTRGRSTCRGQLQAYRMLSVLHATVTKVRGLQEGDPLDFLIEIQDGRPLVKILPSRFAAGVEEVLHVPPQELGDFKGTVVQVNAGRRIGTIESVDLQAMFPQPAFFIQE